MLKNFSTIALIGVLAVQVTAYRSNGYGRSALAQINEEAAETQDTEVVANEEEEEGEDIDEELAIDEGDLLIDDEGEDVQVESGYGGYRGYGGGYSGYGANGGQKVNGGYSSPGYKYEAASAELGAGYDASSGSVWDAWGRDQDLSIDESYGKTNAKSYAAESYDEWDNKDDDKWGAQAWGKDQDAYGASSYGKAASGGYSANQGYQGHGGYGSGHGGYGSGHGGYSKDQGANVAVAAHGAAKGAYDNDAWAKKAYGSDTDSRWGKSYDSVEAKSYDNENYSRDVQANDDQWAEDYDRWDLKDANAYGNAASAKGYGTNGYGQKGGYNAASKAGEAGYYGKTSSDWDAWGRDQDLKIKESYDQTSAKKYAAESYDEWDNQDDDKWGAQAWGKDRDVYGASSYGKAASFNKYGGGQGVNAAGAQYGAAEAGYDNDQWAKQNGGSDFDSRWGKSYDSVSARSYDNIDYDRQVWADDDQWAENYDRWDSKDANAYGNAASAKGYGTNGYGGYNGYNAASKAGEAGYYGKTSSDWDAWGRDQDLEITESYDQTWAKAYDAESYDEWDNQDDDKWGAQAWGKDQDAYGASSYGKAASFDKYGGYGGGYGGYGGYSDNTGYGGKNGYSGSYEANGAAASYGAAKGAYDNDQWAKQAYGSDTDSRWGKSYDSVAAKSYDDEQYVRKVRADDDQWAEKHDQWDSKDANIYGNAASVKAYGNTGYGKTGYGNPGYGYTGYGNSGYANTGYGNPGYGNPGYENTGYSNTGYGNPGYGNTGYGYGNSGKTNYGNSGHGSTGSYGKTGYSW